MTGGARLMVVVAAMALALGAAASALAQEASTAATSDESAPAESTPSSSEPDPDPGTASNPEPAPAEKTGGGSEEPASPSEPAPEQDDANPDSAPADPAPESTPNAEAKPEDANTSTDGSADPAQPTPAATPSTPATTPSPPAVAPSPAGVVELSKEPAAPAPPAPPPAPTTMTITIEPPPPPPEGVADTAIHASAPAAYPGADIDLLLAVTFTPRNPSLDVARLASTPRRARSAQRLHVPARVVFAGVGRRCVRPQGLVPLSTGCKQARAVAAALRLPLAQLRESQVRAVVGRRTARLVARRLESRAPPAKPAVKTTRVVNVQPTVPFQTGRHGFSNEGYSGSSGSVSSSRILAVMSSPTRIALAFRFVKFRVATTTPENAATAPPPARPG